MRARAARRVLTLTASLGAGLLGYGVARMLRRRGNRAGRPRARPPMRPATALLEPADSGISEPRRKVEQRLDEALRQTFPASDPIAVTVE